MALSKAGRVVVAMGGVLVVLIGAALAGLHLAQYEVKERVIAALGPLGSVGAIDVGFTSVRLTDVRLKPPKDWPASDPLHADEITLTPDVRDLLRRRVHLRNVVVSGFTLTVVRSADSRLKLLPNLRESLNNDASSSPSATGTSLPVEKLIDHIAFRQGSFVFYDFSVSQPAYRITLSDASATIDHIHLPELSEPTTLNVNGSLKGPTHTGTVSFGGWIKVASLDSQTTMTLRGVDIQTLDPYLLKRAGAKTQVTGGTLDMTLESTVRHDQLHAPGTVTLHQLQLADTGNPLDTFLSIPTRAVIAALKQHDGDITMHFVLDGNLRDPKFSLRETLLTKVANGFASALGVSIEGVAKGAGETVKGLGNALLNLIGQ